MRFLLDTHALLWALAEPDRLSPRAADVIRNSRNTILASAASAWEIATRYRLGKLAGAEPILSGYAAHLRTLRAEPLPITTEHALKAGGFEVSHRDRFDRMLAAQSLLEGVPLLTNDRAFQLFGDLETIW